MIARRATGAAAAAVLTLALACLSMPAAAVAPGSSAPSAPVATATPGPTTASESGADEAPAGAADPDAGVGPAEAPGAGDADRAVPSDPDAADPGAADPGRADPSTDAGAAEATPSAPDAGDAGPAGADALAASLLAADPAVHAVVSDGAGGTIVFATAAELAAHTRAVIESEGLALSDIGAPLRAEAARDVVGGAGYALELAGGSLACSIGFSAWTPEGGDAVITAGHCAGGVAGQDAWLTRPSQDGGATYERWLPLGTVAFAQFGLPGDPAGRTGALDSIDIAAVDVDPAAGLTPRPAVTDWTTAAADDLAASATPIARIGQAHDGLAVAKSGRTTGVTTGTVQGGIGWARVGSSIVHGFMTTLPAGDGDSGGAVYAGDAALGVVSGGNTEYTWVADIGNALEQTGGYTLRLDLAEPAVSAPADLGAVPAGSALTGTAHPGAMLRIEFAAAETAAGGPAPAVQEVPVGADGAWSWMAPSEPGSYTLRLTSRDGYNASDPTQVRIAVYAAAEVAALDDCTPGEDCLATTGAAVTGPLAAAGALFALAVPLLWASRRRAAR